MSNPYACASFHVEHIDKEYAAGAEPEAEFQEPEGQYKAADLEQEQEGDFTDSFSQQGKHRFIYPSILHKFKFMQAPVHLPQCLT